MGERRPIEEVSEGDLVLSRSEVTGELGYRPVVSTFVTPNQADLDLHPHGDRHGWVEARDLLPGHELFTSRGGWLRVSGATWRAHSATVYNLEVADDHTYFAGDAEAWVHNSCGDGPLGGLFDGMKIGTDDALEAAGSVLGRGYNEVGPGVFKSADGKRMVRMTDSDLAKTGNHAGAPHMNFETGVTVKKPNGRETFKSQDNKHIFLPEEQ